MQLLLLVTQAPPVGQRFWPEGHAQAVELAAQEKSEHITWPEEHCWLV